MNMFAFDGKKSYEYMIDEITYYIYTCVWFCGNFGGLVIYLLDWSRVILLFCPMVVLG